ncbi:amidohydrolase family protein [Mesonia sp. HuA40]|uniref:amidohydrolase family protein n=1 Tax=Mesonia sp. HuA40 TaxID=2602761 RepID=UPI0011CA9678|nr:amidohydrolase family protein [Mesonia sp. HuA40]TXK71071.1 amidohydrolase family protein [Mesonia sp. HuA40]
MKSFYSNSLLIILLLFTIIVKAQQTPGAIQKKAISIQGATLHNGKGGVIQDSRIDFNNGKITYIGQNNENHPLDSETKIIKANNQHIYPGFVVPNSTLGLVEIDAVKASKDENETGSFLPHIRSLIAYNTESKVVESMRPNGVLIAEITPRGGRISGTSSVVQLDAWNWEDAYINKDHGIHLNWPSVYKRISHLDKKKKITKDLNNYTKEINKLKLYFNQAKSYKPKDITTKSIAFEAVKPVFSKEKTLYIHANTKQQITDILLFKEELQIPKIVVVGGYEALSFASELKKAQIPVLVNRPHSLPRQDDEDYDAPFKLATQLMKAGLLVGLEPSGDMERMNARNLPFYAGTCAAYGLSKEEALQLITYNNAQILGINNIYGSLEVGKSATLFISEGDALDIRGNKLTHAFIDGRAVSLETHQTKLYDRYKNKYKK